MTTMYKLKSMPFASCHVEINRDSNNKLVFISLFSYTSEVLRIYVDENLQFMCIPVDCAVDYSPTTARHVNRFTTEFFGKNLYYEFKSFDFSNPVPFNVDAYSHWIVTTGMEYENTGKRFHY